MKKVITMIALLFLVSTLTFAQDAKQAAKQINKDKVVNGTQSVNATTYDFTTGSDKFYGSASGAVEVETGVWGMIAGDTDGSGVVDAGDRSNTWNDRNLSGYNTSDVDLSGVTDAADRSSAWNNRNKSTAVPN